MNQDIKELEQHGTCTIVYRKSVTGDHTFPITWYFKFKIFTDGRLCKFKDIFCARGYRQGEEVDYFEKYPPIVSWTTIRLMLSLSINQEWATIKLDLSYAFVQNTLVEDVYLALPYYFDYDTG